LIHESSIRVGDAVILDTVIQFPTWAGFFLLFITLRVALRLIFVKDRM
jgi:hypothetical protein